MGKYRNEWSKIIITVFILALAGVIAYVIWTTKAAGEKTVNKESGEAPKTAALKENNESNNELILAVLKKVNKDAKTITVYRIDEKKDEMFSYSGATEVKDEFGQIKTIDQLEYGQILELYGFNGNTLTALQVSDEAWEYTGVNLRKLKKTTEIIRIGDTNYQYDDGLLIYNGEKEIPYIELTDQDEITIRGIGKKIHSFSLGKGHGYIRFVNYQDFYGGMVEIGRSIILPIAADMLIPVKEGNYRVSMEKGTLSGSLEVEVVRDEEITVDMKNFKQAAEKVGTVTFRLNPNGATLRVDGNEVDYDAPVKLSYGKHNVEAQLDGYVKYTNVLKVDKNKMTLKIKLLETEVKEETEEKEEESGSKKEEEKEAEKEESSDTGGYNNTADNEETPQETESPNEKEENDTEEPVKTEEPEETEEPEMDTSVEHMVIVSNPQGAEVYLDGVNKGTVPVEFSAKGGSHILTFYRAGYQTKSYPVDITGSMSFTLPDMVKSD